jgi:hypothetical protein
MRSIAIFQVPSGSLNGAGRSADRFQSQHVRLDEPIACRRVMTKMDVLAVPAPFAAAIWAAAGSALRTEPDVGLHSGGLRASSKVQFTQTRLYNVGPAFYLQLRRTWG